MNNKDLRTLMYIITIIAGLISIRNGLKKWKENQEK